MKLPIIDKKEVVPVRFIPFITYGEYGRQTIASILAHELKVSTENEQDAEKRHGRVIARMAAERHVVTPDPDRGFTSMDDILSGDCEEETGDSLEWVDPYAYRLDDAGAPVRIPAKEWRTVCLKIEPIVDLAHHEEDIIGREGVKRQEWHAKTLRVIPDDAFMWKEDLERIYPAAKLNYNVWLDDDSRPLVLQAFDRITASILHHLPEQKCNLVAGQTESVGEQAVNATKKQKRDKPKPPNTTNRRNAKSTFMDDALCEYWAKHKKDPNTVDILMESVKPGTTNRKGDEKYEVVDVMTSPDIYLTLRTKKGAEQLGYKQVKDSFEYRLSKREYRTMTPRAKLPT